VLPEEHRIVVQGVNIRKKHQRQVQTKGRSMNPGIIEFEAPVDISNVMLVCPKCDEPTRVRVQRDDDEDPCAFAKTATRSSSSGCQENSYESLVERTLRNGNSPPSLPSRSI
jgi:ribosomal protein L24